SYKLTQQPVQQECPLISANSPETWSSQQGGSYISSLSPVIRRHLLQHRVNGHSKAVRASYQRKKHCMQSLKQQSEILPSHFYRYC
ncbi:hypothetical protein EK904_001820, partial [Melospiza melodia maxima]